MQNLATVLDIVEAALEGDQAKVRAYAEVLLQRLEDQNDPSTFARQHLRQMLDGTLKKGAILRPCEDQRF